MHKIKELCDKIEEAIKHEFDKGIQNVDTAEMGQVVDIYKDLLDAKKNYYEAKYYEEITDAMEEYEEEEERRNKGQRYYGGRSRDSRGRFTSRRGGGRRGYQAMFPEYDDLEWERDLDRERMGKMYYTESGNSGRTGGGSQQGGSMYYGGESGNQSTSGRDSREGRSGSSRRGYIESKEMNKGTAANKQELENYMKELGTDITEMIAGSTAEEKQILKTKLTEIASKVV